MINKKIKYLISIKKIMMMYIIFIVIIFIYII